MCPVARSEGLLHPYTGVAYVGSFCPLAGYLRVSPESRKVVNLPPDKNCLPSGINLPHKTIESGRGLGAS